ncbi:polysaccharide lyase family 1 protein [Cellulomonas sp. DKR-3]|uniref:Polysaccharide lyase family 1 protein n=1 Tax=Cellulomonas fulva TaxID=2835530 RepID=A0ABS5U135_9CELL|nr:polysaccharide lyase family 1 protein [Cellulomonas fulva]MBT0995085.1 polysaccharide lyase family 1 protein [Cellulomonas fulva]
MGRSRYRDARPLRRTTATVAVAAIGALVLTAAPAVAGRGHEGHGHGREPGPTRLDLALARQVLPDGDGWGSAGEGTTGGSAAPTHVTVTDRAELVAAVAGDEPKIVFVAGTIDANTDDAGNPLTCEDYARDGFSYDDYLAAYDPAVWGWDSEPSGPVEDARVASMAAQRERIEIKIGANTTLVGLRGAEITGAALQIKDVDNVIVRGLTLTDAYDCFPAWDPTDGETGNWNSEWDLLTVYGATNVWIDHNDLSDGDNLDAVQPVEFGRPMQAHDGLLDIVRASDYVTVSWNDFHDHDKVMLIGNSDSRTTDRGLLRVTLHHNEFRDLGQRTPRVRYGQVDVYNNSYVSSPRDDYEYVYSWGLGVESQLVAEKNAFTGPVDPATVIGVYKGTRVTENGNVVNLRPVDLLGAYNAAHDATIGDDAGWTPTLRRHVTSAYAVPLVVGLLAGPSGLAGR